jgi:hypothetical protein
VSVAAVAFVPCAPLLVPQVAGGSAALDEPMRAASRAAVAAAVAVAPDEIVVVAPVAAPGSWPSEASWDFAGFGVERPSAAGPELPWPLGLGAWLLDECGWAGARRYVGVGPGAAGLEPGAGTGPSEPGLTTVIVAVGDGSACRTERAPGYLDPRAEAFDAAIAAALAAGDTTALRGLDDRLADTLLCRSLPVWRWVAAALDDQPVSTAQLTVEVAPYGVGYFVASWTCAA